MGFFHVFKIVQRYQIAQSITYDIPDEIICLIRIYAGETFL